MNKDDLIAQLEHRMFTMQEENAVLMAELNGRIRGFEDKIVLIVKEQEEKD